jgi:U6 snRNA-associated Sm-like protein LSm8
VTVITCDGRVIIGELKGYDQLQNLILCQSQERVFSMDSAVEVVPLGLYMIRGDNVAIISEHDADKDAAAIDLSSVRARPIHSVAQNVL